MSVAKSQEVETLRAELALAESRLAEAQEAIRVIQSGGVDALVVSGVEEAKRRLASIVESSDDAIFSKTLDGTILTWNQGAERLYGYTAAEAVGQSVMRFVPVEREGELREFLHRIAHGEGIESHETVRMRKDGRRVEVSVTLSAIKDVHGKVIGASAIARDITERKRVEEKLYRYELMASHARDIVLCIRYDDGRILEANEAATKAYGYTLEVLKSMTIHELREPATRALAPVEMAIAEERGTLFESVHQRADGSVLPVEVSSRGATIAGVRTLISIVRDITERKQAEEALQDYRAKLEAALSSMTDAVFISDAGGRFLEFNDAFATFHKFKNKAECAKTLSEYPSFLEVSLPNGHPAQLEMWAVPRALRGETVTNAEYTLRRKDTGESWVGSYSFSPIRDKEGAIIGAVVTARDITERKRAEEELRASEARYRDLAESIPGMLWAADSRGVTIDHNRLWHDYTGQTPEQSSGDGWQDIVFPEDIQRVAERWERSVLTGEDYSIEYRIRRASDRTYRWHAVQAILRKDERGMPLGWFGTCFDIEDRKRAEEELKEFNKELTRFNRAAVGRELHMIELKKEVNRLCVQCGRPPRYTVDSEEEPA